MRKILFIDRDGTICKEPDDEQVDRIEKIELLDRVIPNLLDLQKHGYELVMISNQDGLGTSSFPQEDFDKPHNFLMSILSSQGINFSKTLICPHFPDDQCDCRKPELGLVLSYLQDPEWDRSRSAVIGDRESDLKLADKMGIRGIAVGPKGNSWDQISRLLLDQGRQASLQRDTKETKIQVSIDLDRQETAEIDTGLKFFDHMLEQLPRHGGFSLSVKCQGDVEVDDHHTVEDVGLALGKCFKQALGDKRGIQRYGFLLPMDESQAQVALDLGGRPYVKCDAHFQREKVGDLSTEMVPHFFRSFAESLGANIHLKVLGENDHHKVEALFKAVARSLKQAISSDGSGAMPSTKGTL